MTAMMFGNCCICSFFLFFVVVVTKKLQKKKAYYYTKLCYVNAEKTFVLVDDQWKVAENFETPKDTEESKKKKGKSKAIGEEKTKVTPFKKKKQQR